MLVKWQRFVKDNSKTFQSRWWCNNWARDWDCINVSMCVLLTTGPEDYCIWFQATSSSEDLLSIPPTEDAFTSIPYELFINLLSVRGLTSVNLIFHLHTDYGGRGLNGVLLQVMMTKSARLERSRPSFFMRTKSRCLRNCKIFCAVHFSLQMYWWSWEVWHRIEVFFDRWVNSYICQNNCS